MEVTDGDTISWCRWRPTSATELRNAEHKLLSYLKSRYRGWFVNIGNCVGNKENKLWTLALNEGVNKLPLVMLHGMGSGVGLWCLNLDSLSRNRTVYAIDVLGFGRSSRPSFSSDGAKAEEQLVCSIEAWRKELKLEEFVLLGHSMGGYLATSYAFQHPQRVKHLILADPWGFSEPDKNRVSKLPLWARTLGSILQGFNPFASVRAMGPWGPSLVQRFRPDLAKRFSSITDDNEEVIFDYIYHCNAQTPSGESAFHAMAARFGWAKRPMISRIHELDFAVPITFIYGEKSWISSAPGPIVQSMRPDSFVEVHLVEDATHHVYADGAKDFNRLINEACARADTFVTSSFNGEATQYEADSS